MNRKDNHESFESWSDSINLAKVVTDSILLSQAVLKQKTVILLPLSYYPYLFLRYKQEV
jgi:hypothetical protein